MASQHVSVTGTRNIIVQASGDRHTINVYGHPYLTVIPVERRLRRNPTKDIRLLDPAYCAVELIGRESDLNDLRCWVRSTNPIAARALTGQAGAGKRVLRSTVRATLNY